MNDEQILDLYWSRNETAITYTDEKYGKYCFTIAHAILNNREDSEESVNDTWIHTWNAIPPSRPNVFKMFLAKITRNISFDRYKMTHTAKRGNGELALALDELSECVAGTGKADEELEAQELASCIRTFLDTLPKRDGDIFLRRYFFVEPAAQIGERFGLTERNVLVILSRTRKKLQAYLIKEGYTI